METEPVATGTEMNIYQRMHAVMKDISFVQKSEKAGFMYKFVTHDAVTALVRKALVEHGIVTTTDIRQHTQDGNRTAVDLAVRFVNIDNPEDSIEVNAFGYGIDPQDKGPGKAISYAVKYAYLKAFALETGDDPERDNIDHKPEKPPAEKSPADRVLARPTDAKQEAVDALARMDVADQQFIRDSAIIVIDAHENGEAYTALTDLNLDNEQKLAIWSLLPSNVRSAIKKAKTNGELATQP